MSPDSASLVVTAAQLGYAAGIFLLVPLRDRLRHRPLSVTLLMLTGLGLAAASAAPTLPVLVGASTAVGLTTVVPQIIVPMSAGLVPENHRGAVIGTLLTGLIAGILLARTFSGTVGEWLGWRAPYIVAAVLALLLAAVLAAAGAFDEPAVTTAAPVPARRVPAPAAHRAGAAPFLPLPGNPVRCFSAAWTSLALLISGPTYGLGA